MEFNFERLKVSVAEALPYIELKVVPTAFKLAVWFVAWSIWFVASFSRILTKLNMVSVITEECRSDWSAYRSKKQQSGGDDTSQRHKACNTTTNIELLKQGQRKIASRNSAPMCWQHLVLKDIRDLAAKHKTQWFTSHINDQWRFELKQTTQQSSLASQDHAQPTPEILNLRSITSQIHHISDHHFQVNDNRHSLQPLSSPKLRTLYIHTLHLSLSLFHLHSSPRIFLLNSKGYRIKAMAVCQPDDSVMERKREFSSFLDLLSKHRQQWLSWLLNIIRIKK